MPAQMVWAGCGASSVLSDTRLTVLWVSTKESFVTAAAPKRHANSRILDGSACQQADLREVRRGGYLANGLCQLCTCSFLLSVHTLNLILLGRCAVATAPQQFASCVACFIDAASSRQFSWFLSPVFRSNLICTFKIALQAQFMAMSMAAASRILIL